MHATGQRFRHFADWSTNSAEFNILREVERGFMDTFLNDVVDERLGTGKKFTIEVEAGNLRFCPVGFQVNNQVYVTKEGWLFKWSQLVNGAKNLSDFPIWLQYFGKVLFQVVNRSGSGVITRDELSSFYSSVLGLDATSVGQILDLAYQAMTSVSTTSKVIFSRLLALFSEWGPPTSVPRLQIVLC